MDVSCHRPFLPGTSLEPAVIPTAQASSFTLQYFWYYVWCSKYIIIIIIIIIREGGSREIKYSRPLRFVGSARLYKDQSVNALYGSYRRPPTREPMKHTNALCGQNVEFLDAFTKLRKLPFSFVMSDHLQQLGSHWADVRDTWYFWVFFETLSIKFKFL